MWQLFHVRSARGLQLGDPSDVRARTILQAQWRLYLHSPYTDDILHMCENDICCYGHIILCLLFSSYFSIPLITVVVFFVYMSSCWTTSQLCLNTFLHVVFLEFHLHYFNVLHQCTTQFHIITQHQSPIAKMSKFISSTEIVPFSPSS